MTRPRLKQHTVHAGGVTYGFNGLVELMAKATPLRSGDELAGCAAVLGRRTCGRAVGTGRHQP